MGLSAFETWLGEIAGLTEPQRRRAWQVLALSEAVDAGGVATPGTLAQSPSRVDLATAEAQPARPALQAPPVPQADPASVATLGQRRIDSVGCPHCGNRDIVRWGQASALPRYRCKACSRTFNALTKTPLAHLRMKEKWAEQTAAMIDGVSTAKAARQCGVHYTTAFRWRHRFLAALAGDKPKALTGIVEGDETFILESFKGKRSGLPRKSRKRGGKSAKRGLSAEQIPVIVARDRQGATTDAVLPKLNRVSIAAALDGVVTPANEFCCDGGTAIVAFARKAGIAAHILPMPGKPNPTAPDFHLNNVNAYHGRLKEWLRRFHGVATKNLPNYLGWRRTLEALGQNATSAAMILGAIGLGPYQQKTL
ncbi:MAG: IS1595 family transposase [Candidatus Eremiobacteraeota bacterium]|nr:IS1595 family transposase [Candidatus Eremiobacteraeota bacterium]